MKYEITLTRQTTEWHITETTLDIKGETLHIIITTLSVAELLHAIADVINAEIEEAEQGC
jgi:hypothetical protein